MDIVKKIFNGFLNLKENANLLKYIYPRSHNIPEAGIRHIKSISVPRTHEQSGNKEPEKSLLALLLC